MRARSDRRSCIAWADAHRECSLVITQLEAPEVDGLAIGGSLSEVFPGLQTIFLPGYGVSEERLEITNAKVFAEPIDGEKLLKAIERAAATPYRELDLFHVVDVLQMCCLSGRTGAIQIVKSSRTALVFLRAGKIVHAESEAARGIDALSGMVAWESVEFAYDESVAAPVESIAEAWDEVLIEVVLRQNRNHLPPGRSFREQSGDVPPVKNSAPAKGRLFSAFKRR